LEGLLFGTAKGAFTGAVNKSGIFEQAHGGTLFLDEVDSMPLNLQSKLLRFLQERKIRRIGGSKDIHIDVKIISSVSNNPQRALQDGQIRMDLFYRLAVVFIRIPPLRELANGVENLARHFIYKYNLVLGKSVMGVAEEVLDLFRRYQWPGNVRELEHLIEGTMNVIQSDDIIRVHHLPRHFFPPEFDLLTQAVADQADYNGIDHVPDRESRGHESEFSPLDQATQKATAQSLPGLQKAREKELIRHALSESAGNVARAAQKLCISRQLLHYKMKKYSLQRNNS
jgi:arginine utilization regulatory protein